MSCQLWLSMFICYNNFLKILPYLGYLIWPLFQLWNLVYALPVCPVSIPQQRIVPFTIVYEFDWNLFHSGIVKSKDKRTSLNILTLVSPFKKVGQWVLCCSLQIDHNCLCFSLCFQLNCLVGNIFLNMTPISVTASVICDAIWYSLFWKAELMPLGLNMSVEWHLMLQLVKLPFQIILVKYTKNK